MKSFTRRTMLASIGALCALPARAQTYPARPVHVIVPFPPGGALDGYMRVVQPALAEALKQPIVIENPSGASGMIGAGAVAKAAPDGYTVLAGNIQTLSLNPAVYAKVPYDAARDFTPVVQTVRVNYVLVVNPQVPAKTVAELLAYAKAQPGRLTYASSGGGSAQHLATALFQASAGIKLTHVPYKGIGQVVSDLIAGHVDMAIADQASLMPHVKSGKLRALAVGSRQRSPQYPDLPTIAEAAGLPQYEAVAWQGIVLPAGAPALVVERLNAAVNAAQNASAVRARLEELGYTLVGGSADEFRRYLHDDMARWAKVAKDNGITSE